MKTFLKNLVKESKKNKSNEDQNAREAIIELILAVQFVDTKLLLSEQEFLDQYLKKIPWDSGIVVERFIEMATDRVRGSMQSPAKLKRHIYRLRNLLKTQAHRQEALTLLNQMANADGQVSAEEGLVMRWLRESMVR